MKIFALLLVWLLAATPLAAQERSAAYVAQVKAALVAQGQLFQTNCDAAQITFRVAWGLRAQGARLFKKSDAQNGCVWHGQKYSHDAIAFPDGWVDILRSAGPPANANTPDWQWTATPQNVANADVYALPFDVDAASAPPGITPPIGEPPPIGTPPPAVLLELLGRVLVEVQSLRADQSVLLEALAKTRSDLTDLRLQVAHGVSGNLFGYPITLKPVP